MPERARLLYLHANEDESLRRSLEAHLSSLKYEELITSWHVGMIPAGALINEQTTEAVACADIVLLLLSADFMASDICQSLLKLIQKERSNRNLTVVPILVRPIDWTSTEFHDTQALPLNNCAVTLWTNQDEAWLSITQELRRLLLNISKQTPEAFNSAFKLAPLIAPGGSYDSRFYVSRQRTESQADSYLATSGKPTILWGPERFGKTWLLERLLENWKTRYPNGRIARINLNEFTEEDFASYSSFLFQISLHFSAQILGLTDLPHKIWQTDNTPNTRMKQLVRLIIAPGNIRNDPTLLVLDHVDMLLRYRKISGTFFRMLRGWLDERTATWEAFRLLLTVTTSPNHLSEDAHSSPFENLSEPLFVEPFGLEQIRQIAEKYKVNWNQLELLRLHDWVGGHPYLVSMIVYESALGNRSLTDLIENPPIAIERHLRRQRELITRTVGMGIIFRNISENGSGLIPDDLCREKLFQAGLIERVRGDQRRKDHYRLRGSIYKELLP